MTREEAAAPATAAAKVLCQEAGEQGTFRLRSAQLLNDVDGQQTTAQSG
jgi:hypothetical protein